MSLSLQQKAIRQTGIGSSDIGAILGLSPFASILDVYQSKILGKELPDNPALRRGRALEPAVALLYEWETGTLTREIDTIRHPNRPYVLAHLDRIVEYENEDLEHPLEIKTSRHAHGWGPSGTDVVPEYIGTQVHWQLMAADCYPFADVAVLIAGHDLRTYRIGRDRDIEAMLVEVAEKFWVDNVEKRVPPKMSFRHKEDAIEATPEAIQWMFELEGATKLKEQAKERIDLARSQLEIIMASHNAERMVGPGWKVLWSHVKGRLQTDWKSLVAEIDFPDELFQKHTRVTEGHRQFRPTFNFPKKDAP